MAKQLSKAGYRKLLNDESPSTRIEDGLEFVPRGGRAEPPKPTAEQIREQAKQRDPQSWARASAMRKQRFERGREDSADTAELAARRLDEAIAEGSEGLIVARAVEFRKASPAGFQSFLDEQDEFYFQQRDEYGLDPDDFDETELPSNTLGGEVAHAIETERVSALYAETQGKIGKLEQASHVVYNGRLKEKGKLPAPDDERGSAYHSAVCDYILETTGINLAELVNDGKGDVAAEHYLRADAQLGAMDRDARLQVFKKGILEAEDGSVQAGLVTGADETARLLREQNDLLRRAQGIPPEGAPAIGGYDPSFEPPETQAKIEAPVSAEAIKASVLDSTKSADGGADIRSGFTSDGEPVSYSEITRDLEAEQRSEREARESATGPPRSFG
jgi:hypothetical protein